MTSITDNLRLTDIEFQISRSVEEAFADVRISHYSSLSKEGQIHQEENLLQEQFEDSYRNNIGLKIKSEDMFYSVTEDQSQSDDDHDQNLSSNEINEDEDLFMSFVLDEDEDENKKLDHDLCLKSRIKTQYSEEEPEDYLKKPGEKLEINQQVFSCFSSHSESLKTLFSEQILDELLREVNSLESREKNVPFGIRSLNVTLIFSDPEDINSQIIHKEVIDGVPSKSVFKKPFGWNSTTVIKYNGDCEYEKEEVTYMNMFVKKKVDCKKYQRNIVNCYDKIDCIRVGSNREDGQPDPTSKMGMLTFSTKVSFLFPENQHLGYEVQFVIKDPEECSNQ